ncbi:uncharacterized protein LOC129613191 [Condylostylus longicornis]|uniref:uncharacterized protein LOC129613191 n=1 Tax=Condylostylus longicornis TaxID=2530218 RepID=UPI00244E0FE6|nr:uncharacterized protein LOC129613191 [Condylostylus longicornis]
MSTTAMKITTESVKSIQPEQNWQQNNNEKSKFNIRTGNELWDSIITECYTHPTFSCLQKNVFTYLDKTLDISNINVTNRLLFIKNNVDYKKYTKESIEKNNNRVDVNNNNNKSNDNSNDNNYYDSNHHNDDNKLNEIDNEYDDELQNEIPDEGRSAESPIEEVTNALYDKSIKFAMTHDIALKMPEMMFNGATFKVSPRSFEGNGVIVKLELIPKQEIEMRETGRIFKKKIQNFLKNKLLLSFIALVLIIKLIKIKLFWLLPILIGVGAAKKLLLKVLLFFFPALAHIFKLCHYYHSNYHQTKYYHHHHLINHHHTAPPVWANELSVTLPNGPELIFTHPPKGIPHQEYGAPSTVNEHYDNWESSGPGLGSEYLADNIHRNGQIDSYFKPKPEDEDDIKSWGLFNSLPGTTISPPTSHSYKINPFIPKHQSIIANKIRGVGHNPLYVTPLKRLISTHKTAAPPPPPPPINLVTALPNAAQIAAQYDPAIHQQAVHRAQAKVKEALRIQNEQRIIAQQQKILSEEPFVQDGQPIMPKGYDPFYSPILDRMDRIFKQLGPNFDTDYCKERLVCSMYKNPGRYSPQSNFISAELSRDPSELEKPTEMNQSVLRFYRLIQAARDGQEQRDCLRLHPQCSINTE